MQAKLHRWAAADPGRRFDDLFNFVHDPATLMVAFDRVAGNTGARAAGVDGLTVFDVEQRIGVPGFLDDLCAQLKAGTFRPLPVRERKIPKPGGSGGTLPQLRVLVVIASRGPQNLAGVAQGLGVHSSNATRACDKLVEAADLYPDNRDFFAITRR
jgi:hypothetical protein